MHRFELALVCLSFVLAGCAPSSTPPTGEASETGDGDGDPSGDGDGDPSGDGDGDGDPSGDGDGDPSGDGDGDPSGDGDGDGDPSGDGDGDEEPAGTLIWSYDAGDLDKATYDAYVATMPLGAAGRPQPENNNYRLPLPTPPWQYAFAINYEVPELLEDLRVRTYMPEDQQDRHAMFRMYNPDALLGGVYAGMYQAYKYEFEADFSSDADWESITWCIFLQIWGASYPGSWTQGTHPRNPPIALSVDDGVFEVRIYGEHETDLDALAQNSGWTHADSANWPFTPGPHDFEVWVTSDYREPEQGGLGSVRIDMDGETVYESGPIVNAFLSQIGGEDAAGLPMFGVYTYTSLPAPSHADITFDHVRLYELEP